MSFARTVRAVAATSVLAMAVGVVTTTSAEAAGKPAPGPTGLAATVTAHADGTYDVAASWNAVASATSYRVVLAKGGATLVSTTVTTTSWTTTVTTTPGTASLSVRAVLSKKPGKVSTISVPLPDATPPTGGFTATWDNNTGLATLAVTTPVSDNSGGAVTAMVDWNDGSPAEAWNLAGNTTHTYPLTAARYVPVVTLTDSSTNSNPVSSNAVVINDSEAPTGSFTTGPATAWAKLDAVTLTQTALADNWSPAENITRSVDWGDGSAPEAWTTGTTLAHTYTVAGDFTPAVTLTDEAGNPAVAPGTAVHVNVDSTAPVVRFVLPKSKHSVRAFTTLKGKATDTGGTGVSKVTVKAIEKRGTAWYGYNATTKRWVKASTKAKAYSRARAAVVSTGARHLWTVKLSGLRKGTLVYKAFAKDLVKNKSATISHKATLTRR